MTKKRAVHAALIAASFLPVWALPSNLAAQARCAPKDVVTEHLADKYNEQPILTWTEPHNGTIGTFFASPDGKTLTIVTVTPTGLMCLVRSGEDLETHAGEAAEGEGPGT